jgi:hypothetical protein
MNNSFFFDNLLSPEECSAIADEILHLDKINRIDRAPNNYVANAAGQGDVSATLGVVPRLTQVMIDRFGDQRNLKFSNNYTRIYYPGSYLKVHVDRSNLDITLSVCIQSPPNLRWPLYVSDAPMDSSWEQQQLIEPPPHISRVGYTMAPGQGVATLGTRYPHWRLPLECAVGECVIQAFWHWTADK